MRLEPNYGCQHNEIKMEILTCLVRNLEQTKPAMDRFDTFRAFVRVAEARSFTKAATQLGVPRSTVSTAIQTLEARIGQRLLHRTTRMVSLTSDGEAFLLRCSRLLSDLEEAENLFRRTSAPSGHLRVTVPSRIGHLIVVPALPKLLERNPGLTIEIRSTDRRRALAEDDIDCAIRAGEANDDQLISRRLGELAILNCASPAYLRKFGTPRTPADLARHRMVGYIPGSATGPEPWSFVRRGAVVSLDLMAVMTTDNANDYIAAAVAGLGLIQVPAYDVKQLLARKQLVEVLPTARAEAMPIALVYPKRLHLSRRLQAFVEWVTPILMSELALTT